MNTTTISRSQFVESTEELLDRFKNEGGDPAFVIFAWVFSLGAGAMDSLGTTMSPLRARLRKEGSNLKAAARALKGMKASAAQLKKLGFNADSLVVGDELASLTKEIDLVINHYKRDRTSAKKFGPRPERMRYMMTAALISYLEDRKIGTVGWRWAFIGDWTALVANAWDYLQDAAGLRRFLDALGFEGRKLDHHRLRKAINVALPMQVIVGDTMDLKRWWETRAVKSRDALSKDARLIGKKIAASWSGH